MNEIALSELSKKLNRMAESVKTCDTAEISKELIKLGIGLKFGDHPRDENKTAKAEFVPPPVVEDDAEDPDAYLPSDISNFVQALRYSVSRCHQMGFTVVYISEIVSGVYHAQCLDLYSEPDELFDIIMLSNENKGKGIIKEFKNKNFITTPACNVVNVFEHLGFKYSVYGQFTGYPEHKIISEFYGNKRTKRSLQYLMRHIDEGAAYMERALKASPTAVKAYLLHPIVQCDDDWNENSHLISGVDPEILRLVYEYRKCANAFLCSPRTDNYDQKDIDFHVNIVSKDVADMLRADKFQNKKDFLAYHYGNHERSTELLAYFEKWEEYLRSLTKFGK